MKSIIILLIVLLGGNAAASAQQWKDISYQELMGIYGKIEQVYKKQNYQVAFERLVYLDANDTVYERASGSTFIMTGSDYAMLGAGQTVIQEGDIKLVVMEENKTVYLTGRDSVFELFTRWKTDRPEDFIYSMSEQNGETVVQIYAKYDGQIRQCMLYIASDFQLRKMTVHFNPANYYQSTLSDESVESPMMILTFGHLKPIELKDKPRISTQGYLTGTPDAYNLNQVFIKKGFQLVDLRNNKSASIEK